MDILPLLEELRLIARNGLLFADNPHDEARYERLLELVEQYHGETIELPPEQVRERLHDSLGYILGAAVAIFDTEGRLLLMKRADNDTWCLPGGLVEPHESPSNAAIRETREETGLAVQIVDLVDANYIHVEERQGTKRTNPHEHVHFVYLAENTGGSLELSAEGESLDYWPIEEVPEWHPCHDDYATMARDKWNEVVQ